MSQVWQVQEAKARFSELVRDAAESGPQTITVRGRRTAVVLSADDYDRLKRPELSTREFLRVSSRVGVDLKIERDKSLPRDIDL
ncbi:MAG: type II toxin-antitoxin system Phd/YefM family antitoxin [Deltaproteobacteria bacterium]|nr:type II toxin-antitoxin system Phd/YefM family antitoxin [Deltaproteobacteria bacterium]